jgi:CubicO group peptidase (beta-lactamase class C family)
MLRCAGILLGLLLASGARAATDDAHIRYLEHNLAASAEPSGLPPVSLRERMRQLHIPAASIAYIHGGKIAWAHGFGVVRIGGPTVTPNTLFQAGSISKAVTAMGVLKLVEAGKLDLDADVRGYLKRWKIPENKFSRGKPITLRQLLSHTAGMPVGGFPGYPNDAPVPSIVQVLSGAPPANSPEVVPEAAPGAHFQYSGGGYVVAQLAMEDATGIPFAELMHKNVLAPLDMTHSSFRQTLPPNLAALAATPYNSWGPVRGGAHRYPEMAAAGLWSTPSDLARFVIALQQSLAGNQEQGLSPAMARQMVASVTPPGKLGITWGGVPNGYALGLGVADGPHPFFWHDGETDGFVSLMAAYAHGDGVVIMTNGERGDELAGDILRTVAREYHWPNFGPVTARGPAHASLEGYAGHFRTATGRVFTITRDGNALFERYAGGPRCRLLPDSDHSFVSSGFWGRADTVRLLFTMDADGKAASFSWHQDGHDTIATRIADSDPTARWADALTARIDNQTQDKRTEATLHLLITQIGQGTPDYVTMEKGMANDMRTSFAIYREDAKRLGALRTLTFRGVGPSGNDLYEARYDHGWAVWWIGLTRGGKIRIADYRAE